MIERNYGKLQGQSHQSFVEQEGKEDYETLLHWHNIDHLSGTEKQAFINQIGEAELQVVRRSYDVSPPGGESIKDVEKRVNSFIKDLIKKIRNDQVNIAISAHGNSMRPFRRHFENLSTEKMMKLENPWDQFFEYQIKI